GRAAGSRLGVDELLFATREVEPVELGRRLAGLRCGIEDGAGALRRQQRLVAVHGLARGEVGEPAAVERDAPDRVVLVALRVGGEGDRLAVGGEPPPERALGAYRDGARRVGGLGRIAEIDLRQAIAERAKDERLAVRRPARDQRREDAVPVWKGVDDRR